MFAPLPQGFPKLQQAVASLGSFALAEPPQMMQIGQRMRKFYALARERGYQGLSRGHIRRLPYALWLDGEPSLAHVEQILVEDGKVRLPDEPGWGVEVHPDWLAKATRQASEAP